MSVGKWLVERYDVVLGGNATSERDGGMHSESLFDDHVEVWQSHDFVHSGCVGGNGQKFLTKFALNIEGLSERKQTPGSCGARGLMSGNDEAEQSK